MIAKGPSSRVIFDNKWPNNKLNPSPYDIFAIAEPEKINKKAMKKLYHHYVKLYHPDRCGNLNILKNPSLEKSSNQMLSQAEKIRRFKLVSQYYAILMDSNKKRQWDFKNAASGTHMNNVNMNANYKYWNAGTWEDVNSYYKETNEGGHTLEKKLDLWVLFCWVSGLYVCVQGYALLNRAQESILNKDRHVVTDHDEIRTELFKAYNNFGLENDKWSRLRRFLWFRSWAMASPNEYDKEHYANEKMINDLLKKER